MLWIARGPKQLRILRSGLTPGRRVVKNAAPARHDTLAELIPGGCARGRPSRGWGPAGRGASVIAVRAAGRRGAGAPPAEARL